MTIQEKAKVTIERELNLASLALIRAKERHAREQTELAHVIDNLSALNKIFKGSHGYLRVDQHTASNLFIRSDFTAIEELVSFHSKIEFFLYRPVAHLGTYVYGVGENGLLKLVDSCVDSSD